MWSVMTFSEAVIINPLVKLQRGFRYPFIDMASITGIYRSVYSTTYKSYEGAGSRFQDSDTLMARITPCLENRKIAQYKTNDSNMLVSFGSTEFIVIRGRENITTNDFVYYLTTWERVRQYAIDQMTGTSGRQRVPTTSLNHLRIPIPSLKEQNTIASILGSLDDKIELNRRMNETLEEMAKALFKSWFVDFDPVRAKMDGRWQPDQSLPGLPTELYDLFPDRLIPSELGEIPEGWQVKGLDQIADFINGLALQKFPAEGKEYLPVIKIAEMRRGYTPSTSKSSADIDPKYIVNDGDLLFSWSGSLVVVLWAHGPGALNQHLFKVSSVLFPKWFYWGWINEYLHEFRQIAASKATTMGHIQRHHLREAKVVVPTDELLAIGDNIIKPLLDKYILNAVENRNLAELRDTLLPKLISGEIRVDELDIEL